MSASILDGADVDVQGTRLYMTICTTYYLYVEINSSECTTYYLYVEINSSWSSNYRHYIRGLLRAPLYSVLSAIAVESQRQYLGYPLW